MKSICFQMNGKMWLTLVLALCLAFPALAQKITVQGTVVDGTGEPLIGASVVPQGTTTGTATDFDGAFTLSVDPKATLVVSYVGYETQSVAVNGQTTLHIVMKENSLVMDEVVVIGYGTVKKNDATGSVTAIKPDEENKGLVLNPQDMLQGKVAGVNVTSGGGTPGGGATIRIRGGSSLNASNDPLVVIDGLAMDNKGVKGLANPLSMVNPADIESFTVLKDASATAIYGSRGSNGVIIITTKKGKSGSKARVTYNGNVSVSTRTNSLDVMDAAQYRNYIAQLHGTDSEAYNTLGNADTNWQDEIYRVAVSTDHNITVSGGLATMPYRVSVGYTNQNGILDTSTFERFTASLNLSPSFFNNHLKFNINAKGMLANNRYADTGAIGAAVMMDPTQPVKSNDPRYDTFGGYFQWSKEGAALNDSAWPYIHDTNTTANPVALLRLKEDKARSKSFIGNVEVDYAVHGFEDLHLHANVGGDFSTGRQTTVTSPYSATNFYYGYNGWEQIDKYNKQFNAYAQYSKDFSNQHFDIMGGYEWQHFHSEKEYDGCGMYQPTNNDPSLAGTEYKRDGKLSKWENYLVSFFGRANYSIHTLMLTGTVRYDGSSRFKDHWALFPSVALGWRIKDEAFLKDVQALSDLKLRLGYGQTGQQEGIGDYNYFASYNVSTGVGSSYPIIGNGILNRPDAYNANLTWETTTTYNVGLDFGFLRNRITGNVDAYYRKTTDLLNTAYVAAGSNFRNQVTSNIGSLENKGIEASLTVRPIETKDLSWEVTLNGTYNKNEITELLNSDDNYYVATGGISSGTGKTCQAHAVGHPASSFYVYQQVYDANGKPLEGVYVDRNADGIINQDDLYFYKSPAAPYTAGLASRINYKNWDFGFSLRASFDNYVYNDRRAGSSNCHKDEVFSSSFKHLSNRPLYVLENNWQTYDNVLSDYFVENASFLKCDNITLGYSFAGGGISGRVYGSVTNVFTITNYTGLDPEVDGGIDNNIYPRPLTGLLGLTLNF